ncbi:NAD(P)H-binding protein [Streptomyces sp. NPDC101181]|uniref:NAD(P)H-binding protein n=1 Tax=Streptomyces sp. NPDC101181 TaxID=3366125 RepID=UPI0038170838
MTSDTQTDATPAQGPVLVVGGTGKTGRRVVARLRERGVETRAASRSGDTPFDWQDRTTWQTALDGAAALFVVPLDASPSPTPALIEQAVASGVRRIVLLSARGVDTPGYFGPDQDGGGPHGEGEQAVRAAGVPWTILRPGWFAQNFDEGAFLPGVRGGTLALPTGDGRAAFVDADDIADVAVAALTEDGHTGEVYELSGPRALSIPEALEEIAKESGVRAAFVSIDESTFRDGLLSQGVSEVEANLWTGALRPIAASREAVVLDGVRRALGREPRDFTDFVRDAAARGAWG